MLLLKLCVISSGMHYFSIIIMSAKYASQSKILNALELNPNPKLVLHDANTRAEGISKLP